MKRSLACCWMVLAVGLTACTSAAITSPTATPAPAADLAFAVASATLPHYSSFQTSVALRRSNGTVEDVTGIAVWTSSAPDVVTVNRGLITAVGLGNARITAAHEGLTCAIEVVARRNTRLYGQIQVSDGVNDTSFVAIEGSIDGQVVFTPRSWGAYVHPWPVFFGSTCDRPGDVCTTTVGPGDHTVSVRITKVPGADVRFTSSSRSFIEVWDGNTFEKLATIPLPVQTQNAGPGVTTVTFTWPVAVDVFR